jgi:hypothetical protein
MRERDKEYGDDGLDIAGSDEAGDGAEGPTIGPIVAPIGGLSLSSSWVI